MPSWTIVVPAEYHFERALLRELVKTYDYQGSANVTLIEASSSHFDPMGDLEPLDEFVVVIRGDYFSDRALFPNWFKSSRTQIRVPSRTIFWLDSLSNDGDLENLYQCDQGKILRLPDDHDDPIFLMRRIEKLIANAGKIESYLSLDLGHLIWSS